jgi:hypothetical protein
MIYTFLQYVTEKQKYVEQNCRSFVADYIHNVTLQFAKRNSMGILLHKSNRAEHQVTRKVEVLDIGLFDFRFSQQPI